MNERLAYLLGYFYADGSLHKTTVRRKRTKDIKTYYSVSIEILSEDSYAIRNCLDLLKIVYTEKSRFRKNSSKEQTCFYILNKNTNIDLFIEICKNKENTSEAISKIPEAYRSYFLRGFFDGDGCINISKSSSGSRLYFYGSYNQEWLSLFQILKDLNIKYAYQKIERKNGKHKSSHIVISNKHGINIFFEYIYPNRLYDFGLLRKFDKLNSTNTRIDREHIKVYEIQQAQEIKIYT